MNIRPETTVADFTSDQEVRWCPGCGDYSVLKAVRKTLVDVGAMKENTVFVSGIGCSSRFPYYMDTYGFHGIHGRAPAIASGAILANPDLDVWIITGDGDALSIGGNHFMHILRRNFNCQILLFNNEIYGLTKGQYSPTSHEGTKSPTSPMGSIDTPVNPARLALGSGARFVARAVDTQQKQLGEILKAAHDHKGTSFVEIFQNCFVFNDEVFTDFTDKKKAKEKQVQLQDGQPLVYGNDSNKGIKLDADCFGLSACEFEPGNEKEAGLITHNEKNRALAMMLAEIEPGMPVATGVLYNNPDDTYETVAYQQLADAKASHHGTGRSINEVMRQGFTWEV